MARMVIEKEAEISFFCAEVLPTRDYHLLPSAFLWQMRTCVLAHRLFVTVPFHRNGFLSPFTGLLVC
jgi:hypothetical protein